MKKTAWLGTIILALPLVGAMAPGAAMAQTTTVFTFGTGGGVTNGANPHANLTNVNGTLYGTTQYDGSGLGGTLFSYTPGGTLTTLADFGVGALSGTNPIADLTDLNGTLYGTTSSGGSYIGTLFSYDLATNTSTTLAEFPSTGGVAPLGGLTAVGTALYGTTSAGGTGSGGTLFSYTPGGGVTTLADFGTGTATGERPIGDLTDVSGTLYGVTASGTGPGYGTLFSYDPTSSTFTTLASFGSSTLTGQAPQAGVIDVNGTLYGTTEKAGAGNAGTLFSYDLATRASATLVDFGTGTNTATNPYASLTDVNGTLYGTEAYNGANGGGALFAYTPGTGALTTLSSFASGSAPQAGVTDINNTLYGTTYTGGSASLGTLYSYALPPASPVPEPSSVLVVMAGIAGLATLRRRRV